MGYTLLCVRIDSHTQLSGFQQKGWSCRLQECSLARLAPFTVPAAPGFITTISLKSDKGKANAVAA